VARPKSGWPEPYPRQKKYGLQEKEGALAFRIQMAVRQNLKMAQLPQWLSAVIELKKLPLVF